MREIKLKLPALDEKGFYGWMGWDDCLLNTGIWANTDETAVGCGYVFEDFKNGKYQGLGPICQYIGLKDKNGKEIYEGDIVEDTTSFVDSLDPLTIAPKRLWEITWLEDGCWGLITLDHEYIENNQLNERRLEIIGNIHENPELLGVKI